MGTPTTATTTIALPAPEASTFPTALTSTPHWVGYAWELRGEKRTKVPKNPHWRPGMSKAEREKIPQNASTTAPATWADFAAARAFALRHGYGLGFMLAPPFVGIDLDDCRDAATGELSTLGVSVLSNLDTYAEVSVSGTGVKAIAYGEKPGPRCRKNGLELEIYSNKRLFALTGQRLDDDPLQINDCQEYIDHLYRTAFGETAPAPSAPPPAFVTTDDDRAVLDWLTTYHPKFAPLWAGDTSAYRGDDSAADLSLCNMLAFRTGDEYRVDQLFRLSGLYRPKWERGDYRRATLGKAMQQRRFFAPPSPPPSSVDTPPDDDHPLQQENARLRAELAAERDHRAAVHALLTAGGMSPVERVAAYGLMIEGAAAASLGKTSDTDPEARPVNCTAIAENVGLSRQTVSATISRFAERGQLKKATTTKLARNGATYNEIAVCLPGDNLIDNLRTAASWRRPEGTKGVGGNGQRCPKCDSTTIKTEIETKTVETKTISCDDCGHIHRQTHRTIGTPKTTHSVSKQGDTPPMLDLATMRGRRVSTLDTPPIPPAPDRGKTRRVPTPSSVDAPPSPAATPAPDLTTRGVARAPTPTRLWIDPV